MAVRESKLWALHLFSGAALLVLLGIHMGVQHYPKILSWLGWAGENVREWGSVAARSSSPGWAVLYVLLLAFALYHGLYGLRRVLHEVWCSPRATRTVDVLVVAFGLVVFVYGLVAALQATRMGGVF